MTKSKIQKLKQKDFEDYILEQLMNTVAIYSAQDKKEMGFYYDTLSRKLISDIYIGDQDTLFTKTPANSKNLGFFHTHVGKGDKLNDLLSDTDFNDIFILDMKEISFCNTDTMKFYILNLTKVDLFDLYTCVHHYIIRLIEYNILLQKYETIESLLPIIIKQKRVKIRFILSDIKKQKNNASKSLFNCWKCMIKEYKISVFTYIDK